MGDRTGANDCLELLEHPELATYVHETGSRLHASAVVIFGSRARGEHLEVSDYDLAVVSPDFRGLNRLRRRDKLYEVWDEVGPDADADIFGLTHPPLLRSPTYTGRSQTVCRRCGRYDPQPLSITPVITFRAVRWIACDE